MAKIEQGSLDGAFRANMRTFTVEQLRDWAASFSAAIDDPENTDEPKWLQRWVDRINRLADRKERSIEHKQSQTQRLQRRRGIDPE
jgi:hypothetical protein